MKFRTEINIRKADLPIKYEKAILMMGSCFTDNIGTCLRQYLFNISINPFGVSYNPKSIYNNLKSLLEKEKYSEKDLGFHNELYFSFDHYTKFSDPEKDAALTKINESFTLAKDHLLKAGTLILTFGTAYVYESLASGRVVNNCHKIPASEFKRKMLSVEEIVANSIELISILRTANPDIHIIFTVSPVRHIKDGLVENQRSKSTLLLSIGEIIAQMPELCAYFPAYEIMMDDLRDYRYYSSDFVHPNEQAVAYIWELFREHYIDENALKIMLQLDPVHKAISHRPLHTNTKSYREFLEKSKNNIRKLQEDYPFLNWSELA